MKAEFIIPFNKLFEDGTMFSKDCKITFGSKIKVLESHKDENGIRIITDVDLVDVSLIPKNISLGFNIEK